VKDNKKRLPSCVLDFVHHILRPNTHELEGYQVTACTAGSKYVLYHHNHVHEGLGVFPVP